MAHPWEDPPVQDTGMRPVSMAGLLRHLAEEAGELLRSEVALIRLEMEESTRALILDAIKTTLYSAVALLGLLSLLAFLIIGLAALIAGEMNAMAAFWASPLVIGVVFTTAGGLMAWRHARRMGAGAPSPSPDTQGTDPQRTPWGHRRDGGPHAKP